MAANTSDEDKTKKTIPLESSDLEKLFNNNIAEYGYKIENDQTESRDGLEETYRTNIRRQRDKILYTGGFRRLQDKTQVISATFSGDHRTRLTHTLEVEQIAVSISNALRLNQDLVSAIALGHDVGHTPFGHAAERLLNECLSENGGFHHPIQSVKYIWEKHGSKIDEKIYEGILLHDSDMYKIDKDKAKIQLKYLEEDERPEGNKDNFEDYIKVDEWLNNFPGTLEAQVVIWSDKIAYITHDLEDFLRCPAYTNLISNNTEIEKRLCAILNDLLENSSDKTLKSIKDFELRDLIRSIIRELINSSAENIKGDKELTQYNVKDKTEKRSNNYEDSDKKKKYLNSLIINFSDKYRNAYYSLRDFLDSYYICSPEVQRSDEKARVITDYLFKILNTNYKLMPLTVRYEVDKAIICEIQSNDDLKKIYDDLPKEKQDLSHFEKVIKEIDNDNRSHEEIKEEYEEIKEKVVSRKVATYIAKMTDTYAEDMYRNLIGSKTDYYL